MRFGSEFEIYKENVCALVGCIELLAETTIMIQVWTNRKRIQMLRDLIL